MNRKIKRVASWLVFILPICLLIGIGVHKFRKSKMPEEEINTEQAVKEPVKNQTSETEQAPDVLVAPETPPDLDTNFLTEESPGNSSQKIEEEKIAETIENSSAYKKEWVSIYIPFTRSLFFASDISIDAWQNRMAQSEHPVRGKIYYQGENGLIESFVTVDENGAIREVLFSYDPAGNPVDEVVIGLLIPNSSEKRYAKISINKLSVFELTTNQSSGKKQERVTEYLITPQLHFKKGRTFTQLL